MESSWIEQIRRDHGLMPDPQPAMDVPGWMREHFLLGRTDLRASVVVAGVGFSTGVR